MVRHLPSCYHQPPATNHSFSLTADLISSFPGRLRSAPTRLTKIGMAKANQLEATQGKETVLVVDDDESVRRQLLWSLNSDYRVLEAASRKEAVRILQQDQVDVVISDLCLPPQVDDISEGLAIIEAARNREPPVQVVVITGAEAKRAAPRDRQARRLVSSKATDAAEVLHIVNQAARMRRLEIENARLRGELCRSSRLRPSDRIKSIVGKTLKQRA